ncbi:MAG: AbrB/MazE/SpoVT family DNA-binding domain-containing protein [Thermoproteota archaeon]
MGNPDIPGIQELSCRRDVVRKASRTLSITIPRKIAERTGWKAGDIIEFVPIVESDQPLLKLRKVQAG